MRVRDVSLNEFNALANEPDVLPYINPHRDSIDLSAIWRKPGVLVKGCDGVTGAVLLIPYPDNVYEVHWFMPGNAGIAAIAAIIDWVFTHTNTQVVFGPTPKINMPARIVNRALGARLIGEFVDEFGRPCNSYAQNREEWAERKARLAKKAAS